MTQNPLMTIKVGGFDRLLRLIVPVGMAYLGPSTYSGTSLGIGFDAIAAVALLTAVFGMCPLYNLLGICTDRGDRFQENA